MTRSSPGTNFNSSRLVRFLAELSIVDAAESKQAFAERLGQWLDFADAIALHAAHGNAAAQRVGGAESSTALANEFASARAAWASSIAASCAKWPTSSTAADLDLAAAYAPYRRFYSAQQGEMDVAIRPWRNKARRALAQAGSKLGQLASLDAALDKILSARERQLLATVPALLERRFALLASAHRQRLAETGQPDDPARWGAPGGWLADFGKELTIVLLAELDLRLQPTVGLIEALSNEAG